MLRTEMVTVAVRTAFSTHGPIVRRALVLSAFAATGMAVAVPARADPAAYVGKWQGSVETRRASVGLQLVLAETSGTWHLLSSGRAGRENPCFDRDLPVQVSEKSPGEVRLAAAGGEGLAGCFQGAVTLHVQGTSMSGVTAQGRAIKLSRE